MAENPGYVAVDVGPDGSGTPRRVNSKAEPFLKEEQAAEESKEEKRVGLSWGRLFEEARPVAWRLVFGTLFLLLGAGTQLAIPALFGSVIDALTTRNGDQLSRDVIVLVIISAAGALFSLIRAFLFNSAGEFVVAALRQKLFRAVLEQEVGFYDATKTGELISRLASDTAVLKDAVTVNISMGLRFGATAVGGIAYLFALSWQLALMMLGVVPAIAISAVIFGRYVRKLSKEQQKALADASEVAEETFGSIRTVRSFVAEPKQTKAYSGSIDLTLALGIRNAWAGGIFVAVTSVVTSCAFIGIVYYGGTLVIQGDITTGVLTSFLLFALQIGAALGGLASLFGSIMAAMGANDRVFKLLDREPAMPVSGTGATPKGIEGLVELRDVHFSYPTRKDAKVLHGLSLAMRPGEVHALVGSSGGGKSTVVNLIERFYDPDAGAVCVDGLDLRTVDPRWLRTHVGLVRQEPTLFGTSIRENIAFGRPGASQDEVVAAARKANAHEFISAFPDGYDTVVGEKGVRLSGGQKQRVAIARAVLRDPAILLLDEATSALDAESEFLVQAALERLMVGRTVLIIAHRLSTVRSANRVHVVDAGVIRASGTHETLLASSPLYAQLVRRQLSGLGSAATPELSAEATAATAAAEAEAAAAAPATGASGPEGAAVAAGRLSDADVDLAVPGLAGTP
ncbi:hypothetical protein FNF29_03785 [Cafeteria roenbergensis]|uniref:Uncharacterized protein n=1 Tax=Cafeteria roenbergensis TaxID=33653 RepID=A0A5A8CIA4_CAFRO|nr:hypothetical protein FNF29_03785 [Cafeteria roenbergensis]|eukprot:KAA0152558.1 hypothetical protein FNF29_03785 [Cafeteria roenbergensis]